jgi:Bacteriophage tail assembly protein
MPDATHNAALYIRHLPEQAASFRATAAAALRPPDDVEIDDWAEATIELSHRVTSRPGRLRLERYQRQPLRDLRRHVRVVLVWGAQTGKTVILQSFLGYVIDQAPGPTFLVGPNQTFLKRRSRKHVRPLLEDSPALRRHLTGAPDDVQLYDFRLDTCDLQLAWAGSAAQMAGEPAQYLIRDECDKYRDATEKEANSFRLAERRTASYGPLRRIVDATTPTVEEADGWQGLVGGTHHEWWVPCPHCATAAASHNPATGEREKGWQVWTIDGFRYPARHRSGEDEEPLRDWKSRILAGTAYQCRDCQSMIPESRRWACIVRGEWHPRNPAAPHRSYHLPSWYVRSDYGSFGQVAARYVEGLDDPQALQDFMNNDAALPYRATGENAHLDLIRAHRAEYARGTVPTKEPVILVATADVHKVCHFWTVWAFSARRTWLVDWGKVEEIPDLGEVRRGRAYTAHDGTVYGLEALFCDARFRPSEVYDLAVEDDRVIPTAGANMTGLVSWITIKTYPDSDRALRAPVQLLSVNDDHFKELLLLRYESGRQQDGSFAVAESDWLLPRDVTDEFMAQLLGEVVVKTKDRRGFEVRTWKKVGPNHWLDCAKYALAARFILRANLKALEERGRVSAPSADGAAEVYGEKPAGW